MLQFIEWLAVVSSAVFGGLMARRNGMDFVGVFMLAFITAFGGGTIRDLLLDQRPLFWIEHDSYPVIVFFLAVVMAIPPRLPESISRWLTLPDALGLGLFSILGAEYATAAHTSLFIASIFAVITGCFGGVLLDIVCNQIPRIFQTHTTLYATCSFAGSWVYLLLKRMEIQHDAAMAAGILVIVALRLAAVKWNLRLPEHLGKRMR